MADVGSALEGKVWKILGGFLATSAVAIGTLLGTTLINQVSDLHASINSLGAQTARAVGQLSDLSDSHKELRYDINRALATQHEDEDKINAAIVREAETEEAVKGLASDVVRIEGQTRARVDGHP